MASTMNDSKMIAKNIRNKTLKNGSGENLSVTDGVMPAQAGIQSRRTPKEFGYSPEFSLAQAGPGMTLLVLAARFKTPFRANLCPTAKARLRLAGLLLLFHFTGLTPGFSQTQNACAEALARAQQDYEFGRFDRVIERMKPCLAGDFDDDAQAIQVYRLVSLAYIRNDYPNLAKTAVQEILRLNPAYAANPDDSPAFAQMLDELRPQLGKKSGQKKWRLIIGGGLVSAAGITAYFLGIKQERQIPAPPALPDQQ